MRGPGRAVDAAGIGRGRVGEKALPVIETGDEKRAAAEAGLVYRLAIKIVEAAEPAADSGAAIKLVGKANAGRKIVAIGRSKGREVRHWRRRR